MITRMSCSWCHTSNVLSGPRTYCTQCGHRADLPRLACDCVGCTRRRDLADELHVRPGTAEQRQAPPADPAAELAAELRLTADWLDGRADKLLDRAGAVLILRGRSAPDVSQSLRDEAARFRARAVLLRVKADQLLPITMREI